MGSINWSRVIGGGLVAGVVINLVESVASMFYMEDLQAFMAEHGLAFAMSPALLVLYLALGFMVGIVAVWLYAAARSRYGGGPRTALLVAVAVWLLWYVTGTVSMASFGLMPDAASVVMALCTGLVETVAATMLGAWIYREPKDVAAAAG